MLRFRFGPLVLLGACSLETQSLTPTPQEPPPEVSPCANESLRWRFSSRYDWEDEQPPARSHDVDVRGHRVFVTTARGVRAFDFRDLSQPLPMGRSDSQVPLAGNLVIAEPDEAQLAYLAVIGDGVRVLNLGDEGPEEIGAFDLVGAAGAEYANDLRWFEGRLYVAALSQGLWVLNSDPSGRVSVEASCCRTTRHPTKGISDVEVVGARAYATDTEMQLHVIDRGRSLQTLRSVPLPASGRALRAQGDALFVAADEEGLLIYDISEPDTPVLRSQLKGPGSAEGLELHGNARVFVTAGEGGVWVVDVSEPDDPVLLDTLPTEGEARGIDIQKDVLCVAEGRAVSVFESRCE